MSKGGVVLPTLHILGLAHLPSIEADPMYACAYTQKQVRLSRMMTKLGYPTVFYGVEGTQVDATETVVCLSEAIRKAVYGPLDGLDSKFFNHNPKDLAYQEFIRNAIREINLRVKQGDFLLNPMGNYYEQVCNAYSYVPGHFKAGAYVPPSTKDGVPFLVESGIGYTGILNSCHHVFESNTWRAFIYGKYGQEDIKYYDTVIPNFYEPDHYHYSTNKEDYYLMICRQAHRKGIQIAVDTVEAIGGRLILAGQPGEYITKSKNVDYIGYVNENQKLELLAHARALFCTTQYTPPFEGVAVEAMMSGTPVITTNHGCFTETVKQHVTGYRCYTLKEFVEAAKRVEHISPLACRHWAMSQFSTEVCARLYDEFFKRIGDLYGKGWYQL